MLNVLNRLKCFRAWLGVGVAIALGSATLPGQTSALSYQGHLSDGGVSANGVYDFQFTLWNAVRDGQSVGAPVEVADLPVSNGVFSVVLDFGAAAFDGGDRWLQIGVRPWVDTAPPVPLSPRQRITSAPYAVRAAVAGSLAEPLALSHLPAGTVLTSTQAHEPAYLAAGFELFRSDEAAPWTSPGAAGAPTARYDHSVVWTGSEMIVWGGRLSASIVSGQGGIYLPAGDVWRGVSTLGSPSARRGHSAIWTGSEMIVWGGVGAAGLLGDGGRYNPTTGVWSPVAAAGAPSARQDHVAVWTGSRMLIFGGRNDGGHLNDVHLYDPVANVWTEAILAGAPTGRSGTGAVWSGSQLFIWGGRGDGGSLGDGARLNFADGQPTSWENLNPAGAPAGRHGHVVVWAGGRLMVFGGQQGESLLGDGAIYDPAGNTWTPMNQEGAPTARTAASAVWTGTELLVFHGRTTSGPVASGAAYRLAEGKWRPLSNGGNPPLRQGATGVWTGDRWVLFGGRGANGALAAPRSLDPSPALHYHRRP